MKKIGLSETEWKLMDELWEEPPKTITQLTRALEEDTGWGKNVIITMLKRLEAKGAVRHEEGERAKQFYPAVSREDTALEETRGFLNRVYSGSLGLMVDAMVNSRSLSDREIEELKEILKKAEEGRNG
ncbi:BlaI/MecI/CopY family transcriptional regulator [Enterocloster asparagiformis]|uniref:BlaI/MecI/CopY family transcriptional regulator n=1 Tax=Enterocloster asparagiformis TaxID=333367 RepID=A0A413F783_9FIRM|nr:BlaI/MecI/CopY family transcriptional regulator [Enterocloster asparagiformis]RGX21331.1 BlaI/MecI/CopY family transcriptional regulator [Enterocloster asparagiformis]